MAKKVDSTIPSFSMHVLFYARFTWLYIFIHWGFPDITSYHLQIIILCSPFPVSLAGLRTVFHGNGVFLALWIESRLSMERVDSLRHVEEAFLFLYTKNSDYLMVLGFCYSFLAIQLERLYYFCIQLVYVINFTNRFHNNG